MKSSYIKSIIGQDVYEILKESSIDFDNQIDSDYNQIKDKLGITSKTDERIPGLNFAYRAGVMKGICKVIKLLEENKVNLNALNHG